MIWYDVAGLGETNKPLARYLFEQKSWGVSVWAEYIGNIGNVMHLSESPKKPLYELSTLNLRNH